MLTLEHSQLNKHEINQDNDETNRIWFVLSRPKMSIESSYRCQKSISISNFFFHAVKCWLSLGMFHLRKKSYQGQIRHSLADKKGQQCSTFKFNDCLAEISDARNK